MINAKEFRIGNWFKYTNDEKVKPERRGKEFQIIPDDLVFLYDNPEIDYVEGIPLTEEWLLKFGFEIQLEGTDVHYLYRRDVYYVRSIGNKMFYFEMHDKKLRMIKYVHQLQNLYFALTGKELLPSSNEDHDSNGRNI